MTGNTTMLHFFAGLDPQAIGRYPFTPQTLFGSFYEARKVLGTEFTGIPLYLVPCIGAYVGADITSGILITGMTGQKAPTLLVDVGTNGEIVLHHGGKLWCCSAAAGPAFEGGEITMGSMASNGAIDRVWSEDGEIRVRVIGGVPALSICGTGIIARCTPCESSAF